MNQGKERKDILDANAFVEGLIGFGGKIRVYNIDVETIDVVLEKHLLRQTLHIVSGTLRTHQVVTLKHAAIKVRDAF